MSFFFATYSSMAWFWCFFFPPFCWRVILGQRSINLPPEVASVGPPQILAGRWAPPGRQDVPRKSLEVTPLTWNCSKIPMFNSKYIHLQMVGVSLPWCYYVVFKGVGCWLVGSFSYKGHFMTPTQTSCTVLPGKSLKITHVCIKFSSLIPFKPGNLMTPEIYTFRSVQGNGIW